MRALTSSIIFFGALSSGCAPAALIATESLVGTAIGAAGGSGVGYLFSREVGNTTENILINGAIGAGVGLLAGLAIHQQNVELAREQELVARQWEVLRENQMEIDSLRQRVYDASSWGANETKPWNERYLEETSDEPYQGRLGM